MVDKRHTNQHSVVKKKQQQQQQLKACSMNKFSLGSYNKEALVVEHDYSFRGLIRIVSPQRDPAGLRDMLREARPTHRGS